MDRTLQAPSSKSVSHRALICSALAPGVSTVYHALDSNDIKRTADCLARLGAGFSFQGTELTVTGIDPEDTSYVEQPLNLYVADSGTTCRLIIALAAAFAGDFRVFGTERMHNRPVKDLTDTLAMLGITCTFEEKQGYPPVILTSQGLSGGEATLCLDESSQYLSGILLAAPLAKAETMITITGSKVVSWPYVGITLQAMEDFGVNVTLEVLHDGTWTATNYHDVDQVTPGAIRFKVKPTAYKSREYTVEGDWSNASYFVAASALLNEPFLLKGLRKDSLQGDKYMLDILEKMGATITWNDEGVIVQGGDLRGIEVDMNHCPDIVPTVATLASMIKGKTHITNVAHLRIKECDRLDAVCTELAKAGCKTIPHADSLEIIPQDLITDRPVELLSYDDHRMPMSLSLLELKGVQPVFDKPECVAKSFPHFWETWEQVRGFHV